MTGLPKLIVQSVQGHGEADDGDKICIQIEDQSGQQAVLMIPHQIEEDFLLRLQGGSQMAAKERGIRPDSSAANALNAEEIDVGITPSATIGLRVRLSNGMTLNLTVPEGTTEKLGETLAQLNEYQKSGGPKKAQ